MRVKVGDTWFEATPEQPLCVELAEADKSNIEKMTEKHTKYAVFHDDDKRSQEEMREWMRS